MWILISDLLCSFVFSYEFKNLILLITVHLAYIEFNLFHVALVDSHS